jgi:hypothetical protein
MKSKILKIKEFNDIASSHMLREVSPPDEAKKDPMIAGGKSTMTIQQATAKWFKTAKEQMPSKGFLEEPDQLDPVSSTGREMLYKGKNKKLRSKNNG